MRLVELAVQPVRDWLGRGRELRAAHNSVVSRLKAMRTAEGKVWDDEKYALGPELDRLREAIGQRNAAPLWADVEAETRERVLVRGDRTAIDDCLRKLEALR